MLTGCARAAEARIINISSVVGGDRRLRPGITVNCLAQGYAGPT